MAKSWTIKGKNQNEVKTLVERSLAEVGLPSMAAISWEGHNLQVSIAKAGKSQFTMTLESAGADTVIKETNRSVAFVHKPFVAVVETFVDKVMQKVVTG
jgi:hypothetical protein